MKTLCVTLWGKLEIHQHYHQNDTMLGEQTKWQTESVFQRPVCVERNDLKPNLASFQKFLLLHCWHSPHKGGASGREGKGMWRWTALQGDRSQEGSRIDWKMWSLYKTIVMCKTKSWRKTVKNGNFSGSLGKAVSNIAIWHAVGDVQLKYMMGKFTIQLDLRSKNRSGTAAQGEENSQGP